MSYSLLSSLLLRTEEQSPLPPILLVLMLHQSQCTVVTIVHEASCMENASTAMMTAVIGNKHALQLL